jgi:hypothetical protein
LNVKTGDYATQAKPILALIDSDCYRIDAYFEETTVPQIRPGSTVKIPHERWRLSQGRVESIARGITDQVKCDRPELLAMSEIENSDLSIQGSALISRLRRALPSSPRSCAPDRKWCRSQAAGRRSDDEGVNVDRRGADLRKNVLP